MLIIMFFWDMRAAVIILQVLAILLWDIRLEEVTITVQITCSLEIVPDIPIQQETIMFSWVISPVTQIMPITTFF